MIRITHRTDSAAFSVNLPDPSRIPVAAVANAAKDLIEADAAATNARRGRDAARAAVTEAENAVRVAAARLKIKKKDLPKDIRRPVKEAREAFEDALLLATACSDALEDAHRVLRAELVANRERLESAALKQAEKAVNRQAAARESFRLAEADAEAAYGLLGMFSEADKPGALFSAVFRERMGSKRGMYASQALEVTGEAVGHGVLELDRYRKEGAGGPRDEAAAEPMQAPAEPAPAGPGMDIGPDVDDAEERDSDGGGFDVEVS